MLFFRKNKGMNIELQKFVDEIIEENEFKGPVCGSARYVTDQGSHEFTFHCSSPEARFWDFERGSQEQINAMQHWDQSKREVFISPEDAIRFRSGS
jgi:hypothetical protein